MKTHSPNMRVSSFSHSEDAGYRAAKEHMNSFRAAGWRLNSFSPIFDDEKQMIVGSRFLWEK